MQPQIIPALIGCIIIAPVVPTHAERVVEIYINEWIHKLTASQNVQDGSCLWAFQSLFTNANRSKEQAHMHKCSTTNTQFSLLPAPSGRVLPFPEPSDELSTGKQATAVNVLAKWSVKKVSQPEHVLLLCTIDVGNKLPDGKSSCFTFKPTNNQLVLPRSTSIV